MKSVKNRNKYEGILGTDEGGSISAGKISGKFMQLIKPVYPDDPKKVKVKDPINAMVLVGENGNVKAKTLCAKNSALAAASGQAAFASKFSPTVKDEEPTKAKGATAYNSNHWLFNFLRNV